VANGAFILPGVLLVGIGVDAGDDGSGGLWGSGAVVDDNVGVLRVVDGGCFGPVAVAFEDFFGRDVGAAAEEGGVVEDQSEIFGNLCRG
jgi:hypothetical protein